MPAGVSVGASGVSTSSLQPSAAVMMRMGSAEARQSATWRDTECLEKRSLGNIGESFPLKMHLAVACTLEPGSPDRVKQRSSGSADAASLRSNSSKSHADGTSHLFQPNRFIVMCCGTQVETRVAARAVPEIIGGEQSHRLDAASG